jgi:hypothetical protein
MRRLGSGICVVLVALVLAYGAIGTDAWFTDDQPVGVSTNAGRLDITASLRPAADLRGPSPCLDRPAAPPADRTDPTHLDTVLLVRCLEVANPPDSTPAKYRIRSDSSGGGLIVLRVACPADRPTSAPQLVWFGPLDRLSGGDVDGPFRFIRPDGSWGDALPVGGRHCYLLVAALPRTGAGAPGFELVVDATQEANPGW